MLFQRIIVIVAWNNLLALKFSTVFRVVLRVSSEDLNLNCVLVFIP